MSDIPTSSEPSGGVNNGSSASWTAVLTSIGTLLAGVGVVIAALR